MQHEMLSGHEHSFGAYLPINNIVEGNIVNGLIFLILWVSLIYTIYSLCEFLFNIKDRSLKYTEKVKEKMITVTIIAGLFLIISYLIT